MQEHIDKIVAAYRAFEEVERFAHVADLEEIEANDFNLNISRYVDTTQPVEVMSVEDALAQLRRGGAEAGRGGREDGRSAGGAWLRAMRPASGTVPTGWKVSHVGDLVERLHERRGDLEPEPTVLSCSKDQGLIPQLELFQRRLASVDSRRYKLVWPGNFVYDPNLLWSGSIARNRLGTKGIVSPVYEVFKVVGDCSEDFLYEWLISPKRLRSYRAISMGTNVRRRRADFSDFSRLPILLPPVSEQRAIAGVLDAIDETIERTEAVIAATERLRDSLLHELLTRGVPGWHRKWKEVAGVGTMPECWEVVRLGEVCTSPQYGAPARSIPFDPRLPRYVRITDLTDDGRLRNEDARSASPDQVKGYELEPGDLLFARSGATVGKTYLYRTGDGPCVYAGYLIRFRPLRERALPEYVELMTRSQWYWRWVASILRAGAQPNINAAEYSSLRIALPSLTEQLATVDAMESVGMARLTACEKRKSLQSLKSALADALLTGRIRTSVFAR